MLFPCTIRSSSFFSSAKESLSSWEMLLNLLNTHIHHCDYVHLRFSDPIYILNGQNAGRSYTSCISRTSKHTGATQMNLVMFIFKINLQFDTHQEALIFQIYLALSVNQLFIAAIAEVLTGTDLVVINCHVIQLVHLVMDCFPVTSQPQGFYSLINLSNSHNNIRKIPHRVDGAYPRFMRRTNRGTPEGMRVSERKVQCTSEGT